MTRGEKRWMAAAVLRIAWGSFLRRGVGIHLVEPSRERYGVGANFLLALLMSLAPVGVGLWLAQRTRHAAAPRHAAGCEQTMLQVVSGDLKLYEYRQCENG